ncbi:hypothetical protein PU683_11120 [Kosakonia cowanii]|uniref:hypothetical protein n=1 Tax=Kosakonia cowanii TaxID=208223 RepID=UPI0023F8A643|nr:hypothetical protein [Kosakonia cowanii]MDF7760079.1 hypothetical protein [Kosakonia cowanii]
MIISTKFKRDIKMQHTLNTLVFILLGMCDQRGGLFTSLSYHFFLPPADYSIAYANKDNHNRKYQKANDQAESYRCHIYPLNKIFMYWWGDIYPNLISCLVIYPSVEGLIAPLTASRNRR